MSDGLKKLMARVDELRDAAIKEVDARGEAVDKFLKGVWRLRIKDCRDKPAIVKDE